MSLLSEFKGNVVLSTDTGTSTKVNKIDANLATPASSTVMSIGSNIVGGTIKIGENIENPGTLLLGNSATGTTPQLTNIVQVQGRFQSNFLRTKTTNGALAIADDQSAGGTVGIGSYLSTITTNGVAIKQVQTLGAGVITNVVGNAGLESGMTTTFNRKFIGPGGAGVGSPINCYTITSPFTYTCEYFEIIVAGCNDGPGGYSYKGCFSLNHLAVGIIPSTVTTLFSYGGTPVIGFTVVGSDVTLSVNTSGISAPPGGISTSQRFVTTLMGFPTIGLFNGLIGYSVVAI